MDVKIVSLDPMRVAAVRAVSETPEIDAWRQLRSWAESQGLVADGHEHPVFGFNNPNPAPDRRVYGYEYWLKVDPEAAQPAPQVAIKDVPGGMYAVVTSRLTEITDNWKNLWEWVQAHGYRWRRAHELERVQNPLSTEDELVLDLYLPIER